MSHALELPASLQEQRLTRRAVLRGTTALGAGVLAARLGLLRAVAQETESVKQILDIAVTAEAMAVTLLGGAIDQARKGAYDKPVPDPVIAILEGARAAEQFHYEYLTAAGAQPLTTTFTIPDTSILTKYDSLFQTIVTLDTAFIAAYMAAAQQFTRLKQPDLVRVAFQIAGVEAEHRVLANVALGTRPANDVAFEAALFQTVGQAATALKDLGYIGGRGPSVTYPGPGAIRRDLITQQTPGDVSAVCEPPTAGGGPVVPPPEALRPAQPKPGAAYFPETNHNVSGAFLQYWQRYGGLPVFGYPLTEEFEHAGIRMQYFERARFELHPGSWPERWDVLLGLLGREVTTGRQSEAPFRPSMPLPGAAVWGHDSITEQTDAIYFMETQHNLAHGFLRYWWAYGGLPIFGYPISEEFRERNRDTGKEYVVQYFERARFEWHPGEWPERWDVLLGRLGAELLNL
jgi:hypothetical protein